MAATTKTLVRKQGKPSKPGTVVDTSTAKVIPPSPEVRIAQDAAKSKAKTDATIGAAVAKMTSSPIKRGSVKAAVAIQKARNGSGPTRRTGAWTGKDGRDVKMGNLVKTVDGLVGKVISRWTKHDKEGRTIPFLTLELTGGIPKDGTLAVSTKTGNPRATSAAAGCTHVK